MWATLSNTLLWSMSVTASDPLVLSSRAGEVDVIETNDAAHAQADSAALVAATAPPPAPETSAPSSEDAAIEAEEAGTEEAAPADSSEVTREGGVPVATYEGRDTPTEYPIDLDDSLDPYGRDPSHPRAPGRGWIISGYVFGAVGTGLTVASLTYLGLAADTRDTISNDTSVPSSERADLIQEVVAYDQNTMVFAIAGGATVAVAAICYAIGMKRRRAATRSWSLRLGPQWTPRGVGARVGAQF